MRFLLLLLLLVTVYSVTGCASQKLSHGIPSLRTVDAEQNILRGGEPRVEGWAWLRSVGISNVVELNSANDTKPGFTFNRYPISLWHQIVVPPRECLIDGAVSSIMPGTFIHCAHGQDRTGLVVADYRVWHDGWDSEQARDEMLRCGFHRSLFALNYYWNHHN